MAAEQPARPEDVYTKGKTSISVRTIGRTLTNKMANNSKSAMNVNVSAVEPNTGRRSEPTKDPADPLNWPTWKKEIAFASVLLSFATAAVLKTILVPTNSVIALQLGVSYLKVTALTGVPFIVGAFAGMGSTILSSIVGKRMLYVLAGVLMLAGGMWTMQIEKSYGWFMVSRCMQGLGWGVTDFLIGASIRDLYFENQRQTRRDIMNVTSLVFTWGSPILGGYVSQTLDGYHQAYMIITIIQGFSIFLLLIVSPETTFDRTFSQALPTPVGFAPKAKAYLKSLSPVTYHAPASSRVALQALRAMATPTTLLTVVTAFPLVATSFALVHSLGLLFARMPTFLFPARLGYLLVFPAAFSIGTYSLMAVLKRLRPCAKFSLAQVAPGMIIGGSGLLAFGLYISSELMPEVVQSGEVQFTLDYTGDDLNLKTVSALLGMVVAGATTLLFYTSSYLATSTAQKTPSNILPIETAYQVMLDIFTGIFVISMPTWIQMDMATSGMDSAVEMMMMGLKEASVGIAVVQLLIGGLAAVLLWFRRENIASLDRRVMGLATEEDDEGLPMEKWDSQSSFYGA